MAVDVARVSAKGQVVIPQSIRKSLGLLKGEQMLVVEDEGAIVMKPMSKISAGVEAELLDMKLAARAWKDVDAGRAKKRGRREFLEDLSKW